MYFAAKRGDSDVGENVMLVTESLCWRLFSLLNQAPGQFVSNIDVTAQKISHITFVQNSTSKW